jgi:hypothetical protein
MDELIRLELDIEQAEQNKKAFVKAHATGEGDSVIRAKLYLNVERARKALRVYKMAHSHL